MRHLHGRVAGQMLGLALCGEAAAHEWYTDKTDPVLGWKCCGQADCRPLDPDEVSPAEGGGYFVTRPFSYWSDPPERGWFIPRDRVQIAPDDRYHICEAVVPIKPSQPDPVYALRWTCFFAPMGTSSIAPAGGGRVAAISLVPAYIRSNAARSP